MGLDSNPRSDIVAAVQALGLQVTDPDLHGRRVAAESASFRVVVSDERDQPAWESRGLVLDFMAKEPGAGDWPFTVDEAQRLAGLPPVRFDQTVASFRVSMKRLSALTKPLDQALAAFRGRGDELRAVLRRLRFPS